MTRFANPSFDLIQPFRRAQRVACGAAGPVREGDRPARGRRRRAVAQSGFSAVRGPEEYGGQGVDAVATCIVMEEVARVDASASLIPGVNELGTIGLILRGSESSRNRCCRRWLPARPWPLTPCRSGNQAATPLFGIVHVLGVGF